MTPHPLVQRLHELREGHGLSRYAATRAAGLTDGAILSWENGRFGPTVHNLDRYARIYGFRLDLVPLTLDEEHEGEDAA